MAGGTSAEKENVLPPSPPHNPNTCMHRQLLFNNRVEKYGKFGVTGNGKGAERERVCIEAL